MRDRYQHLRSSTNRLLALLAVLVLPLAIVVGGCDSALEQDPFSSIQTDKFFNNAQEFEAAASGIYAHLRNYIFNPLDMTEHSSDEIMVPTRGIDWNDGGQWRQMTQHTWDAGHPFVNGTWNWANVGIARTNGVLSALNQSQGLAAAQKAQFGAEVRFLRAYFYYNMLDLYGRVPIVVEEGSELPFFKQSEITPTNTPPQHTRKEVFDFILQELTGCTSDNFSNQCITNPGDGSTLANLPAKGDVPYGRATQGAGYALLARLLINAEVYSSTAEALAGGSANGTAMYEFASLAADQLINGSAYSLEDDYYLNFAANNFDSDEVIFAATYKAQAGLGFNKHNAFLHYNMPLPATPWNGFTTIAEMYKSFDVSEGPDGELGSRDDITNDERLRQFMRGKQYESPNSNCVGVECFSDQNTDVDGDGDAIVLAEGTGAPQLDFSLEIPALILDNPQGDGDAEVEAPGLRPLKFELDPGTVGAEMGNDFPLFRLAEMYLIKAEAVNEVSGPAAAAQYIDALRDRAEADAVNPVPGTQAAMRRLILQERGREMLFEAVRRQDLIRYEFAHGGVPAGFPASDDPNSAYYAPTWTGPWLFKDPSGDFRALFPIPDAQISVNPNLTQNPGYN